MNGCDLEKKHCQNLWRKFSRSSSCKNLYHLLYCATVFFILYISHDPSLFCFLCSFVYTFVEPRKPMNCMVFSEWIKRIDLNYY